MSVQLPRCACWILKQLIKLRSHALTHKMLYTSRHRNSPAEGVGAREAHRKHCMWVSGRDALHTLARASMKNILCANTHTGTKSCEYTCTHAHSLSHRIHSFFLSPTIPGSPGVLAAGRAERESRAQSREFQVLHKMTEAVHDPERCLTALPKKLMERH